MGGTKRKAQGHNYHYTTNTNNNNEDDDDMWASSSSSSRRHKGQSSSKQSKPTINEQEAEQMFQEYADPDDTTIASMDGICKLCEELNIDPLEDIRILVLLWKMGANGKPAQISQSEWMSGCQTLQLDSIAKFQALVPSLDTGFLEQNEFKNFYKFCFQFNREGTHRTLHKEMVATLLQMVLVGRVPQPRLDSFCAFLMATSTSVADSHITLDQWTSFLDFCYECQDLSDYDEDTSAWPVLIDEYVEYMEEEEKRGNK